MLEKCGQLALMQYRSTLHFYNNHLCIINYLSQAHMYITYLYPVLHYYYYYYYYYYCYYYFIIIIILLLLAHATAMLM